MYLFKLYIVTDSSMATKEQKTRLHKCSSYHEICYRFRLSLSIDLSHNSVHMHTTMPLSTYVLLHDKSQYLLTTINEKKTFGFFGLIYSF